MQTPPPYASVILKLLQGVIYYNDPHWERLQSNLTLIQNHFNTIGLKVQNYESDGFAYLEQPEPDPHEPSEPLPRLTRRIPLTRNQTIFCVLLREELRRFESSDATGRPVLSIEKIRDLLNSHLPEKNDEEKSRKEIDRLVNQMIDLGFLRKLSEQEENYEILAVIKAKIKADDLEKLKEKLEKLANKKSHEQHS